jgi:hypothetical protein
MAAQARLAIADLRRMRAVAVRARRVLRDDVQPGQARVALRAPRRSLRTIRAMRAMTALAAPGDAHVRRPGSIDVTALAAAGLGAQRAGVDVVAALAVRMTRRRRRGLARMARRTCRARSGRAVRCCGMTARALRVTLRRRDRGRPDNGLGVATEAERRLCDRDEAVLGMTVATTGAAVIASLVGVAAVATRRDAGHFEIGMRRMAGGARAPVRVRGRGLWAMARGTPVPGWRVWSMRIVTAQAVAMRGGLRRGEHVLARMTAVALPGGGPRSCLVGSVAAGACSVRCRDGTIAMAVATRTYGGLHERVIVVTLHASIVAGEQRAGGEPRRGRQLARGLDVARRAAFSRRARRCMRRMTRQARGVVAACVLCGL